MAGITLEINKQKTRFADVWVHLQELKHSDHVPYIILIHSRYVNQVFDPSGIKDASESWPAYIERMVCELGTFFVEGFIKNIVSILGKQDETYRWVIANVEGVCEAGDFIEIKGQVVPFKF